jgi:hypothetical protein
MAGLVAEAVEVHKIAQVQHQQAAVQETLQV